MAKFLLDEGERPTEYQNQSRSTQNMETQSEEAESKAKWVFQRYKEAKGFKKNYDGNWDRYYKLYMGQHWQTNRPEWKSAPVINFIFSVIETIIPIMTDSNPTITAVPRMPDDAGIAEVISNILKKVWADNRMQLKLPTIVKNTLKYGTGFCKVWWNPELANGLGDVAISVVDPRHVYPSPGAIEIDDAEYIIYAANVPISLIERMFPENKDTIPPGVWDDELTVHKFANGDRGNAPALIGPIATTDGSTSSWPATFPSGQSSIDRNKMATLIELWDRDENGRAHVTIMANGILLRDSETPFRHNKFPFVKFIDYTIPSCFWGMGDIQQLEPLQDFINKRRGQTQDILRITSNPPLIVDSDSGVNPKAITTRPGIMIFKSRGSEVKWLQPPQIPSALFEVQELDKKDFDAISGVYDVTQGKRPTGIEAASAITELQEAAQTRIRFKTRNMESSLEQLGELAVSLIQEFYTEERTIRLVGTQQNKPQFVTVNEEVMDENGSVSRINDVSVGEFDIEIGVGSTMPVNKARRYTEMMEMYQAGIVDGQAVLENSTLSPEEQNRITMRMQQQQAMMQEQQMAAMGGDPTSMGGQPPPPPEVTEEELEQLEQSHAAEQLNLED